MLLALADVAVAGSVGCTEKTGKSCWFGSVTWWQADYGSTVASQQRGHGVEWFPACFPSGSAAPPAITPLQPNQQQTSCVFNVLLLVNCFANNGQQQHQRVFGINNQFVISASDVEAVGRTGKPNVHIPV